MLDYRRADPVLTNPLFLFCVICSPQLQPEQAHDKHLRTISGLGSFVLAIRSCFSFVAMTSNIYQYQGGSIKVLARSYAHVLLRGSFGML